MTTRRAPLLGTAAVLLALLLAAPAQGQITGDFDDYNSNSISLVGGDEQGRTTFWETDITYDTSAYTLEADIGLTPANERTEELRRGSCPDDAVRLPAKSAWIRFKPAVSGTVSIAVDSTYNVYSAMFHTDLNRGVVDFTDQKLIATTCQDASDVANEGRYADPVKTTPGQAVLIMTASICDNGVPADCSPADEAAAIGGPTTVHFRFVPDDADGDGVADTIDNCDTVDGPSSNFGCPLPDGDKDGVPDSSDQCPTVAGEAGSGCPPDADGDGIANSADACVFTAGIAPDGCPDPDPDRDGISGSTDACPFEVGRNANGCPDPDGDRVINELDKCPLVKGLPSDGCPDTDGDGVSDRLDRCRTTFGRGADGCLAALDVRLPDRWRALGRTTTLLSLRARAPLGSKLTIRCVGRRSCRLKPGSRARRSITIRKTSTNLLTLFRSRRLRAGSAIEIRVSQKGSLTRLVRYDIRNGRIPKLTTKCLNTSGKAVAC